MDFFFIGIELVKAALIFFIALSTVPLLVWLERRGSAFIQNRFGPNRVGPLGLVQLLADAVKFLSKEEFFPQKGVRFFFVLAPLLALIPAGLAIGAIPFSAPLKLQPFELFGTNFGPYNIAVQGFEIGVGIVFVLGVSSLGVYSTLIAGWASGSKYPLFGALRASAQMISYELSLGLSLVGALMLYGSFSFASIIEAQNGVFNFAVQGQSYSLFFLPNWGIFYQPLGAYLFFVAALAETNRLPFDLPEAEAELVAGYHTEYGGIKMNMFYIGEYIHMMVASALMVIFFFGGYSLPFVTSQEIHQLFASQGFSPNQSAFLTSGILLLSMLFKVFLFLWIFIWVRWSLPRFRYDQLMSLGWKKLLPWALANTILTALIMVW